MSRASGFRPTEGALHDAALYQAYRPRYPARALAPLARRLRAVHGSRGSQGALAGSALKESAPALEDLRILDLGCGGGQAIEALMHAWAPVPPPALEVLGIDPNPEMIEQAATLCDSIGVRFQGFPILAEDFSPTTLPRPRVDAVVCASSLHWLDFKALLPRLAPLLTPETLFFVIEYQFPQVKDAPELNDWLKEQFRKTWRFESQRPRGRLRDLVREVWAEWPEGGSRLSHLPLERTSWEQPVNRSEFIGLLSSQARVLAALARDPGEAQRLRAELEARAPETLTLCYESESILLPPKAGPLS
jgi:SAM-dependent methyltransferase